MGKYEPLGQFLRGQKTARVPMTFEEIEQVIGGPLPPKAQHHRAWWSNNPSNNVMTKVWLRAGYESEQVDMASRKLVFRRALGVPGPEQPASPNLGPAKYHPLLGALKGLVHIMPGTDLTKPADPNWGRRK